MDIKNVPAYELLEKKTIADVNSVAYRLKHKKSGAKICVLENNDNNKVFYIGFRTPPKDSTGVAHILEHSVLCGSKAFPSKDPFVELVKGSLNTFLNAMTYPDKTVYPVASCNEKDFQNLCHVYLDAVFRPNIYSNESIFRQEGWRYEYDKDNDSLSINGVVYNEMKGAFSSSDDVMQREVFNSLYPDTSYGVESGGDPKVIPELTYEDFLEFHKKYYSPSNSYIYLYGDCDMEERLNFIDKEYLSNYDAIEVDSFPGSQKPFEKVVELQKEYPIAEDEDEECNTYLTCNAVISNVLDNETVYAFQIIDYALCNAQGAPLKQALIDAGIGSEVYSVFDNGIYQPYFSIVSKNANLEDKDEFLRIISKVIDDVITNGFNKDALLAGINNFEFIHKEADFGSYPRGLVWGLGLLDTWLYDDNKPFVHIELNQVFDFLKKKVKTSYFEDVLKKCFVNNTHKSIVTVVPKKGLVQKEDKELADKLKKYRKGLSDEELQAIIETENKLNEFRDTPDSEEVLKLIPRLERKDLTKKANDFVNEERSIDNIKVIYHNIFTSKIAYLKLIFDITDFSDEMIMYASLLKSILSSVSTKSYSFEQLGYEINKYTGTIDPVLVINSKFNDDKNYNLYFGISGRATYDNIHNMMKLIKEILFTSKLKDYKRIREIVNENVSILNSSFMNSSHVVALNRCLSYTNRCSRFSDICGGIEYYDFLKEIADNYEAKKEEVSEKLENVLKAILRRSKMLGSITSDEEGYKLVAEEIQDFICIVPDSKKSFEADKFKKVAKKEGFTCPGKIQYVCRAGNFVDKGLKYTGTLRVLQTILAYNYLWTEVRVNGGAYGCMSAYQKNGNCFFVSYRDPNLEKTNTVFENAYKYLETFEADEEEMTKYIIGTLSNLDMPQTPYTKGEVSFNSYLSNFTNEDLQEERDAVLNADSSSIRKMADYIKAFIGADCLCVIGGEEMIKKNRDMFDTISSLS